ncbi:MAG: PrsW family intramembrane metalloprotease [Acidobacteria bacterium]|nr:PrsW family intramembrane metalloprotease [Acidobacteriota bacterium]
MVIKIFIFGALSTLPTLFIEVGALEYISFWFGESHFFYLLFLLIGIPLIEETLKYLVVRDKVLRSSELDEPADVILYMIISALGFAAVENILQLIRHPLKTALIITFFRFWGAIFLHALCSGFLGYFLALALFDTKNRIKLKIIGISGASFLHSLFNFSTIGIGQTIGGEEQISILNPFLFLIYFF